MLDNASDKEVNVDINEKQDADVAGQKIPRWGLKEEAGDALMTSTSVQWSESRARVVDTSIRERLKSIIRWIASKDSEMTIFRS